MTESVMLGYIHKLADQYGLLIFHCRDARGSGDPGFPDLLILGRSVLFRELKQQHGDLRWYQKRWARALHRAGENVEVWRPGDWHSGRIQRELEILSWTTDGQLSLFDPPDEQEAS